MWHSPAKHAALDRIFVDHGWPPEMNPLSIFRENKLTIVDLWIDKVFSSYPLETTGFLRTRHDPFANPVGNMTREAGNIAYDAIAGEQITPAAVKKSIERFVKLRAAQNDAHIFSMGIFYLFKPIMREKLLEQFLAAGQITEFLEAESRLDSLVLIGFDIYVSARDTLAEARIREIRSQYAQLGKWAKKLEE